MHADREEKDHCVPHYVLQGGQEEEQACSSKTLRVFVKNTAWEERRRNPLTFTAGGAKFRSTRREEIQTRIQRWEASTTKKEPQVVRL
jgi:hypothetical protein